ncbi:hypothetical protein ACH5A3_36790 [Streptomyces echinatus]|uniref:hypothetical protein n=1 Tax=Streptomyces echinatus TaxID=67293 RepID=UPI00378A537E
MPKHAHYQLGAGEVYKRYRFDVYEKRGKITIFGREGIVCLNPEWVKAGTSTADQFWTTDHRLTKGRKAR